uniref:Uncharacterized protein n=1 Tax=Arundo donax TaxID=35708 RepID=A0A0A9FAA1_ARUDO
MYLLLHLNYTEADRGYIDRLITGRRFLQGAEINYWKKVPSGG